MPSWKTVNRIKNTGRILESAIERWAVKYALENYGWDAVKMNMLGRRGEPDRLFLIHGGRPLYIEFKRKGKRPTKLQQHRAEQLRSWGYLVETCDSKESAITIFEKYGYILETQMLSVTSCKVLFKEQLRGRVGGPWSRENNDHVQSVSGAKRAKAGEESTSSLPIETSDGNMATRKRRVARVSKP